MTQKEKLAGELYEEYCIAVGGKAFNGDPLPNAEEFFNDPSKNKQADAWIRVAEYSYDYFKELND